MNLDQFRAQFSDETVCREYLESQIWKNGRKCPNCGSKKSWHLTGNTCRPGLYECGRCKRQFTVTTGTPLHATKLPLCKWLNAMYFIANSSKGIASVFLGRWLGVSQRTAWKMGHAIRELMAPGQIGQQLLSGTVEMDDKFIGGKPRYQEGVVHKRGKGTDKAQIIAAVERDGAVVSTPIVSDKTSEINPVIDQWVDRQSHLMTDKSRSYVSVGNSFNDHSYVNHSAHEYSRDDVHNNTTESFFAMLERARLGVFHSMSERHLHRYLNEAAFRWTHREPIKTKSNGKKRKTRWRPLPIFTILEKLLANAVGCRLKRLKNGGLEKVPMTQWA